MFDKVLELMFFINTDSWKKDRKYQVRRMVVAAALAVTVLVPLIVLAGNLHWVGTGYCWGSIDSCYFGGK